MNMTLPAFPSQDLAKLVLGYLAEEQLMTAYDEFLQASPYLDALRNEYDRIFMTSLKIILAEYRAVKIYVETCKPFVLRKKLLQCSNLLDIVKLLVNYVDVNKLHLQDSSERNCLTKQNIPSASKQDRCDTCQSLDLTNCTCQNKQPNSISSPAGHVEASSLQYCIEATVLEDLPGNYSTVKKKHLKVLEKDPSVDCNSDLSENIRQPTSELDSSQNGLNCSQSSLTKSNENVSVNSLAKAPDLSNCGQKIEEFHNILNKVCINHSNTDTKLCSIPEFENADRRISNSRFQAFASGICVNDNRNVPVPDSSTSENSIIVSNNSCKDIDADKHEVPQDVTDQSGFQPIIPALIPRIKPKCSDQKIKIISDIKVDHQFPKLKNATSTPLIPTQTIVINGTPAYKQKIAPTHTYTKDEIMAMPTIIVVPTSGPPKKDTQAQSALAQKIKKTKKKKTPSTKMLEPLVVDVSSSPVMACKDSISNQAGVSLRSSGLETGLVKTVDVVKNASVPKNVTISGTIQTITPEILPPERKSSSTPRRNSHIRVLDFATPRRILCDTIPEETSNKSVEVVVAGSPNIVYPEPTKGNNIIDISTVKVHKIETCHITSTDENKQPKKNSWDTKLRALAVGNATPTNQAVVKRVRKSKKKQNKTDTTQEKSNTDNPESKKSRSKRKISPKGKKAKRRKMEEEEEQYNNLEKGNETNIAIKPTFNIVRAERPNTSQETTKSNVEVTETPEEERLLLQNELGAKLNISDLLETPYKQALYDIQMDTPKFIGSVLPDEPISDIKIMNIPTPRFFDTPKPTQATPSYSSRATDYSSGGSYYKPDEQDYLRIPDIDVAVTSSILSNKEPSKEIDKNTKRNVRPVRRCTKNVSYRGQTNIGKSTEDIDDVASSYSETSVNSSFENNQETVKTLKTPKVSNMRSNFKYEKKNKMESSKTRKTPTKKDKSNAFMKIKPRRPTPVKDNKRTKRTATVTLGKSPKHQIKKKASGKEKSDNISPKVTCVPTKSRRKSSTPRKLHCTKQFNSESSVDSPEQNRPISKLVTREQTVGATHCPDSDTEQLALRWSDECSQESKTKGNECEDISKIKEYIELSLPNKNDYSEGKGTLQVDLIKRGFDAETAKIIERDLLDTPEENSEAYVPVTQVHSETTEGGLLKKSNDRHTDGTAINLITESESTEDDLELSISECNEESSNYVVYNSETKDPLNATPVTLKDAWSMEVCIDDGVTIRLRATSFNLLFDNAPQDIETGYCFRETEVAVSSITNIEKLYTPLKDRRSQYYEIFDSTLTSLDTPLKTTSPKNKHESHEIGITVEEEKLGSKDKCDTDKEKILQVSNEETLSEVTKPKSEAQFSFGSANIQNIDIESVLEKLHGP